MKRNTLLLLLCYLCLLSSCNDSDDSNNNSTKYSGYDINNYIKITTDKSSLKTDINIQTEGEWKIYKGNSPETIDLSEPFMSGFGNKNFSEDFSLYRNFLYVVTESSSGIISNTLLPLSGTHNTRDLGGIRTQDGKYIKWNKLFRSDDLSNLTDKDLEYLCNIPIKSTADFRSILEVAGDTSEANIQNSAYNKIPATVDNQHQFEFRITPGRLSGSVNNTEEELVEKMKTFNLQYVTEPEVIEQFKLFFQTIQDESNLPIIYNCSGGKDRSGMATALILYSLGVDEDTIYANYLASNDYLADKYSTILTAMPELKPIYEVRKDYLKAAIDRIIADHGSVDKYLKDVLKVDTDKMKKIYLY